MTPIVLVELVESARRTVCVRVKMEQECSQLEVGSCEWELWVVSCKLGVGSWELGVVSWELGIVSWGL